ncbi:hypothetical protein NPIL_432171 [Nephila pilipes]|uniref:Uncharacterized protein n=1 Tax=Nephila pilipes TaxID=299642 RepID=A0A8X6N1D2_NEPPI|nr:hypothetical protein NPIL_432171 [Nephila pilipes]
MVSRCCCSSAARSFAGKRCAAGALRNGRGGAVSALCRTAAAINVLPAAAPVRRLPALLRGNGQQRSSQQGYGTKCAKGKTGFMEFCSNCGFTLCQQPANLQVWQQKGLQNVVYKWCEAVQPGHGAAKPAARLYGGSVCCKRNGSCESDEMRSGQRASLASWAVFGNAAANFIWPEQSGKQPNTNDSQSVFCAGTRRGSVSVYGLVG